MRILSLRIEQFRSYEKAELAFPDGGLILLVGPNGSGKTNVVEAVSYLSTGRSCLGLAHEHAMRWGTEFFRVRAQVMRDSGEEQSIEFVSQMTPKRERAAFVNDVRVSFVQFVGRLPTIIFLPQDLDLFTGGPQRRRGFLDAIISQLQPDFLTARLEYERILKQRNALLKRIADGLAAPADLDPWDEQLALHGAQVQSRRLKLMQDLLPLFIDRLKMLGETWTDVRLVYQRTTTADEPKELVRQLRSLLADSRAKDMAVKSTCTGPHRDDWHVEAAGHDIAVFASRGQQRSCLLSLLLSATTVFEAQAGEKPVVILDDVFSELDDRHQEALIRSLETSQVLFTSTHVPPGISPTDVWDVQPGGVISRRSS